MKSKWLGIGRDCERSRLGGGLAPYPRGNFWNAARRDTADVTKKFSGFVFEGEDMGPPRVEAPAALSSSSVSKVRNMECVCSWYRLTRLQVSGAWELVVEGLHSRNNAGHTSVLRRNMTVRSRWQMHSSFKMQCKYLRRTICNITQRNVPLVIPAITISLGHGTPPDVFATCVERIQEHVHRTVAPPFLQELERFEVALP